MDIEQARIRAQAALERADKEIAAKWANSHRYPSHLSDVPLLANNLLNALEELEQLRDEIGDYQASILVIEHVNSREIKDLEAMNMDLSAQLAEANRERR